MLYTNLHLACLNNKPQKSINMKKTLLTLTMAICAMCANAEGVDWYFVYDGNGWATDETTQFQTTDTENVYLLANYQVNANAEKGGLNYQITNKSWSKMYGWCAEADGNDIPGSTYKLGSIGNAWINCESGKYDITFNAADETIRFDLVSLGGGEGDDEKDMTWFFVYDGNSWVTDTSTELKATEVENVYVLDNYQISADADKGGISYQITNQDWTKAYGWCAEADGNDYVGSTYKLGTSGAAWLTCESGTYTITFNSANETIRFDLMSGSGVDDIYVSEQESEAVYYTIDGKNIEGKSLQTGLYIKKQGNKVSKIYIK